MIVAGRRAAGQLAALATDPAGAPAARATALRALEAIGGPQALEAALRALEDGSTAVAQAAVPVLHQFLKSTRDVRPLDRLTAVAVDRSRPEALRLAAFDALATLPASTVRPLLDALADDPSAAVRARLASRQAGAKPSGPAARLTAAAAGRLPDDPTSLRDALSRSADRLSLPELERLVDHIRGRERASEPAAAAAWAAARASVHAALARRGSRLALYDVRETLEAARAPLPVEFITTLVEVGDASCLEPIAAAYARVGAVEGDRGWWRRHLVDVFRVIVARERVTRRHAGIRKIGQRWPGALDDLWPAKRRQ